MQAADVRIPGRCSRCWASSPSPLSERAAWLRSHPTPPADAEPGTCDRERQQQAEEPETPSEKHTRHGALDEEMLLSLLIRTTPASFPPIMGGTDIQGSKARSPSSPWELISAGQKKILRPGCFLAQEPVQEARAGGGSTGVRPFQALSDEEGEVPTASNCPLIPRLGFVHVFPPEEYLVLQGLCLHWPFMDFSSANHFDACIALKQSSHFFLHCSAWSFCWR
ncbi:uncharacterized protein LOC125333972 [Corvus hawaiiensis]|uniref:uncharacterized protein LOC125333972 n=1 Tax=Corvus hawaiiensis TaxID=134902 RepID=UPI0020189CF2|nr:uncharacterized protein LOC125333972 [Corvus hawaiiensis]